MNANELTSIDQVRAFPAGTQRVAFEVAGDKQSRYDWLRRTLVKFDYLRQSQTYRRRRHTVDKTRPVAREIGVRRKPQPDGQPGYIRIDTVHQGDNYHRPCLFPETVTDKKGKQCKRYPYQRLMTPYEKLKSPDSAQAYLKPDLSFDILDRIAYQISDNAVADALQQARRDLFTTIHDKSSGQTICTTGGCPKGCAQGRAQ